MERKQSGQPQTEEDIYRKISDMAEEQRDELIQLRRDFHRYPETSWLEMRTSAKIAEYLTELGMEVLTGKDVCREEARIGVPDSDILERHFSQVKEQGAPARFLTEELEQGYTGVVGILRCGEGPTVALRFDIDALPMEEAEDLEHRPFREGFSSQNPGMMHACGHDCHAAIGLGTARILSELRDQLHGTVKFLFQPGEEGTKGAYAMVENGHLDGVDYFAGTHVAPDDKEDDGDITPGTYGSLATCKYNVFFHGQAAHAAVGLSGIARHSQGISRVNVGVIRGGSNSNVVADEAMISMEVRGETDEINQYMDRRAKEICQAAAMMEECSCEMRLMGRAPSQVSSPELIERISNLVRNHLPQYQVSSNPNAKNWGSEDIGFMMNRVQEQGGQAVYMRTMTKMASPQHTVRFDVDEDVLVKGAVSFSAIVCDLLKKN